MSNDFKSISLIQVFDRKHQIKHIKTGSVLQKIQRNRINHMADIDQGKREQNSKGAMFIYGS